MMFYVFGICLLISVGVLLFMASRNYSNIDIHYWTMVVIIPLILLGYTLKTRVTSVEEAKVCFCFIYLDSTVLLMLLFTSMVKSLGVKLKSGLNVLLYTIAFAHILSIWIAMPSNLYYATIRLEQTPLGVVTKMTDGPLKATHYIYLACIFVAILSVLAWCYYYKQDCSKKMLSMYGGFAIGGLIFYVVESFAGFNFSILPYYYVIADVVIAYEYENLHSHDMDCVIVDQKKEQTKRGYVAFDEKLQLLGYTENALFYVPELRGQRIDSYFDVDAGRLRDIFYTVIEEYEADGKASDIFTNENTIFKCDVTYFYMHEGGKPAGYLVEIHDVTAEQGYINLIKEYGQSLEQDVEQKTEHIRFIQQRIVLGMATIIENRDMNTGGHVRRTSDIIKIIVDEMMRLNIGGLDSKFADEIVRSAPMHDLGKISIDNSILNKPGKLTDEEYAIMKTHSAKSGEIVKAILSGVEEPHFVQTAYQLARFHHERWDGKGYPERLTQVEIPIEARIMAVADVYDALVSKRCYKEAMSFEKAREIMMEGMGTQFDPMMGPVFEGCREQLEAYYRTHNE